MSASIKVVTSIVLVMNAAFFVGAYSNRMLIVPASILSAVILLCYWFWTPVAYDLSGNELIVSFRIGTKRYAPVVRCSMLDEHLSFTVRLFGNGGLFAGSGIFWNRKLGVFRAYVTSSKMDGLVLVETSRTKVVISPENPLLWLASHAEAMPEAWQEGSQG